MKFENQMSKGAKSDFGKIANVRHLTRIITYLSEVEYDYAKSIERKTGIGSVYLKGALLFLLNYKIIFIVQSDIGGRTRNMKYYGLNPFYKTK